MGFDYVIKYIIKADKTNRLFNYIKSKNSCQRLRKHSKIECCLGGVKSNREEIVKDNNKMYKLDVRIGSCWRMGMKVYKFDNNFKYWRCD